MSVIGDSIIAALNWKNSMWWNAENCRKTLTIPTQNVISVSFLKWILARLLSSYLHLTTFKFFLSCLANVVLILCYIDFHLSSFCSQVIYSSWISNKYICNKLNALRKLKSSASTVRLSTNSAVIIWIAFSNLLPKMTLTRLFPSFKRQKFTTVTTIIT